MADSKIQEEARLRYPKVIGRIIATGDLNASRREAFIAGAKWQKEQMKRDCSVQASYEAEIEKAEERGYNLCKEQMLKYAVVGKAVNFGLQDTTISVDWKELNEVLQSLGLKAGDRAKIIIVKEGEE